MVKTKSKQRTSTNRASNKISVPRWLLALGVFVIAGAGIYFVYNSYAYNANKMYIYNHESGNNPAAVSPDGNSCGLGQWHPCSELKARCAHWATNYQCQDKFFTNYMTNRYRNWTNAKRFWVAHGWW